MKEKTLFKVYAAAIIYSLIIGFSFVFTKFALEYSDPINILGHRFLASIIGLIIYFKIKGEKFNIRKEEILDILPLAIAYPLVFFGLQTFGLQYAPSSEAGILLAVGPIFTLILSGVFLKEKTTVLQKLSIILSVLGVVFIFYMKSLNIVGEEKNLVGTVLLLLTALSFAIYSVMVRKYSKVYSNNKLILVMIIISFIGFNILAFSKNIINGNIMDYILPLKNLKYIIAVFYLGILSSLLSAMLTNYVLSKIEAAKMSVFSNLGTLISIIAGAIVLNEDIFYYHIIGSIFIILGVIGTNISKNKEKKLHS